MTFRAALAAVAFALLAAGCAEPSFTKTPCKPAGEPTHGTIAVQLPLEVGEGADHVAIPGTCVGLMAGDDWIATAKVDATGNATLALPQVGDFYVYWQYTRPTDHYCEWAGIERITVPGQPARVVLDVQMSCQ